MTGAEVKQLIVSAGLKCWQVAELWGVNDGNFSRKLRFELSEAEKAKIFKIIEELKEG